MSAFAERVRITPELAQFAQRLGGGEQHDFITGPSPDVERFFATWRTSTPPSAVENLWGVCSGRPAAERQPALRVSVDWETSVVKLLENWSERYVATLREDLRTDLFEKVVLKLTNRISQLESKRSIIVPIQSLDVDEFVVVKEFCVVVQTEGDSFTAAFFDANLNASGDTQEEAVSNLKDLMVSTFEKFDALGPQNKLGPEPTRQLLVMKKFIKRQKI